jgi:hypothetical protein
LRRPYLATEKALRRFISAARNSGIARQPAAQPAADELFAMQLQRALGNLT